MTDRTMDFTLHLPLETVVAFAQLWKRQGNDPAQTDVAALIEGSVNSLVPWFESKGWVSKVENAEVSFEELFGYPAFHNFGSTEHTQDDPPELAVDGFSLGNEVEAAIQAKLREQELEKTKRSTAPTEVADIAKPPKLDLLKVNRMDIDTLAKLAPKDVLIEKILKGIGDPIFRAAVEIVYTSLSPELWGTSTATQAVQDMIQRHEEVK